MVKRNRGKNNLWWKKPSNIITGIFIFIGLASSEEGAKIIAFVFNLTIIAGISYVIYQYFRRRKRFQRVMGIYEVDKMDGLEFEHYLVPLFEKIGYKAEVTKGSGDFGADLVLRKGRKKFVVQAKRYNSSIGVSAVQQVVAAMAYYRANGAMVVTNNYFTPAAEDLARYNKVRLIDRDELSHMISKCRLTL